MKKVFLAAGSLLLLMIVSCNDAAKNNSAANSDAEKNKEHILSVYRGIESGDLSKMDEFVADDIVDHGGMADVKSRDSVKKMLSDIHNHFSNLKMELLAEGTASSGDYHFTMVRMTGTTKDAFMGMPANTSVDRTSVDVVKFVNGKATEHWKYANPREMMQEMSMNKPAEAAKMDDKMMDNKNSVPAK